MAALYIGEAQIRVETALRVIIKLGLNDWWDTFSLAQNCSVDIKGDGMKDKATFCLICTLHAMKML